MPAASPSTPSPDRPKGGAMRRIGGLLVRSVLVIAFSAVLVGLGFAAGWLFFAKPESPALAALMALQGAPGEAEAAQTDAEGKAAPKKVPAPLPEEEKFVTTYFSFAEPLTTNLAGSRRYLMASVTISTQYDAAVMTNVETHKAALQSDMLAVIGTFSEADLAGREGRERLGLALRDAINARLEALEGFGGIEGVYFPSFVMQ